MTTATATFTVTVKAAAPPAPPPPVIAPLLITDATDGGVLADETEGEVTADPVCTVTGGVPPYAYKIAGLPAGVSLAEQTNADGSVSITTQGTPEDGDAAQDEPYQIQLSVSDSSVAQPQAATSRTISS